ncbi:NUDIX hydrolase [soil metagenome]
MSENHELADDIDPAKVVSSDVVWQGKIFDMRRETFDYGDSTITRDFLDHPGAVAVLVLDENERVLLIQQYRHPIGTREWEIPAGLLDIDGESPLIGAQRELAEEVDLVAEQWDLLADFATTPGGSNEVIRIYLARGISAAADVFDREEEEADIVKRWVSLDDLVDAVLDRTIGNSILSIAALSAFASRAKGWTSLGDPESAWPRHPKFRH